MRRLTTSHIRIERIPNKRLCDDRSQQYGNCTLPSVERILTSSEIAFSPYQIAANGTAPLDRFSLLYYSPMTAKKLAHRPTGRSILSHVCVPTADVGGIPLRNTTTAMPFSEFAWQNDDMSHGTPECIV